MSAYRPAAEKTTARAEAAEDDAADALRACCLCDGLLEGGDVPELQPRIDLPRKGGDAGRKRRCVPRDAHGDHDRIELRRGGRTIEVRRPTPIGRDRPQIGDHADDLVPGPRLALAAPLERSDSCAHGIPAHHAHERLVDHDGPVRRPSVSGMQGAAGHDPGAERVVIAGTDSSHRESALEIALQASRRCTVLLHFQRHPLRGHRRQAIAVRHVRHTRLLTQPARELFVCTRATRADLRVVRHTALAGQRLGVHPEAEGEVTLRRKRCPLRPVLNGGGVDSHRGGHEQQRARHLRADDERPDAAELHRPAGAGDPLQSPQDGPACGLQCRQQADQCRGDEREQQRIRNGGRLELRSTQNGRPSPVIRVARAQA